MTIKFKTVDETDAEFLYEQLKEREGYVNISHKSIPTWDEHLDFIKSKPYFQWDIIFVDEECIGNIYLTNRDEIGIFIKKKFQSQGFGSDALKKFLQKTGKKRFLANFWPEMKVHISREGD